MKTLNYTEIINQNPTLLDSFVNQSGQTVNCYEHPTLGDESPVIVEIEGVMVESDFWDLGDFYEDSEYNPILWHGEIIYIWETI